MYIKDRNLEDNIFFNIGVVKGKVEVLSDTNISRGKNEVLNILNEINNKMDLIYKQAVQLEYKNKKIEVPLFCGIDTSNKII